MGEYDVVVQNGGIEQLGRMLKSRGLQNPIIVTDENVAKLHAEKVVAYSLQILVIIKGNCHPCWRRIQKLGKRFWVMEIIS